MCIRVSHLSDNGVHHGPGPIDGHFLINNVHTRDDGVMIPEQQGARENDTTLRNMAVP